MRLKLNNASKTIDKWHNLLQKGQYQPLITVWSGPKGTRRHLYKGWKSKRKHHFLSDGERRLGILMDAKPETINFFEQYPLWDIKLCVDIAVEMGIKYPCDIDGEAYILSTDFMCFEMDAANPATPVIQVARTYKTIDSFDRDLKHPVSVTRTLQKLELEKRYYKEIGIKFVLETDASVSVEKAKNLKWAKGCLTYIHECVQHELAFNNTFIELAVRLVKPLKNIIVMTAKRIGISQSDAHGLFQWGIWTQRLPVDLDKKIWMCRPVNLLRVD